MMNDVYEKFLKSSEEFIFAENKPEKSDINFCPWKWLSADGGKSSRIV